MLSSVNGFFQSPLAKENYALTFPSNIEVCGTSILTIDQSICTCTLIFLRMRFYCSRFYWTVGLYKQMLWQLTVLLHWKRWATRSMMRQKVLWKQLRIWFLFISGISIKSATCSISLSSITRQLYYPGIRSWPQKLNGWNLSRLT